MARSPSDTPTGIICRACRTTIPRPQTYCPNCGAVLSASQLTVSVIRKMEPGQFEALVAAKLVELGRIPRPLSSKVLRLAGVGEDLIAELQTEIQDKPTRQELVDRIVEWSAEATSECLGGRGP